MNDKGYYISKKGSNGEHIFIDYDKFTGYNITPRNNVKYDGIIVNKMIIVNQSMIEKVLKRKIKKKLDLYLKIIIEMIENNSDDDGTILAETLNDLERYKSIINYKYEKYLDEKYLNLLRRKIALLEYELKQKIFNYQRVAEYSYNEEYQEEKTTHRRR